MDHWRTAYKHNVAPSDIDHALAHPVVSTDLEPRDGSPVELVIGPSRTGVLLEVIWIEGRSGPLVIHAMPLRNKFRHLLEEN